MKRSEDDVSVTSSRWRVSASRAYELSPDLREKQVEMLCRKYGGASRASHAARVIQQAYRRYRLGRSFARMRLEAAAASPATTHGESRLSRCFADVDTALAANAGPARASGSDVRCRVRARDGELADASSGGGRADAVRWADADQRRQVAVHKSHSVTVTSTTTTRHHHRVVVRAGCCANPDTSSVASSDDAAPRPTAGVVVHRHERRALQPVTTFAVLASRDAGSRSDDELLSDAVVPRTAYSFDDIDELTDVDAVPLGDEEQPTTTTTFQQLCLTDSSYGEMAATEPDSDADDSRLHYVDGEALEAGPRTVPTPRYHVYSSLRLCKHSTVSVADQSKGDVQVCDSPIWKRKEVADTGDDSKKTAIRCVGCGWRGQSAPQLNDNPAALMTSPGSGSVSTGSLAAMGN